MTGWTQDVLGPGWEQRTTPIDVPGAPGAVWTLVRRREADSTAAAGRRSDARRGTAVLYVHGYNDYFFQTHLADAFEDRGYRFHAVDLHGCGRSQRPGMLPHYCTDLRDYADELGTAARTLRAEHDRLVVVGHSTGGLVASLWAHLVRDRPGRPSPVDALVLNSPWFELNVSRTRRALSTAVLGVVGVLDPLRVVEDEPSAYTRHLHVANGGRWEFDRRLKRPEGLPARAGWLRAVRRGQARLAHGLAITAPVLVCTSTSSGPNRLDNPELDAQDTILDVQHIAARAPRLGPDVTVVTVPGGIHDLSLSAPGPRSTYLRTVLDWLDLRLGTR